MLGPEHLSILGHLMKFTALTKRSLVFFVVLSGLVHLLCLGVFTRVGSLDFAPPVIPSFDVRVILPESKTPEHIRSSLSAPIEVPPPQEDEIRNTIARTDEKESEHSLKVPTPQQVEKNLDNGHPIVAQTKNEELIGAAVKDSVPAKEADEGAAVSVPTLKSVKIELAPPLRRGDEFLATAREKLTYRITMLGLPIGEAVIEAAREPAGFHITTSIKSNPVISAIYPVDNFVETRLINGNYLVTKIRQREGGVKNDMGFTLKFREKTAFWADRTRNLYANDPLPREDVLDFLCGFYYLRTHRLEVGKPVELYLYDSNEYAPTSVEVLRRESVTLPGSRKVDAIVVHPMLKTEGFFKRNGEVLIWLTDDENKVPVKMETTIALGRVTAELVSAESERERGSAKDR